MNEVLHPREVCIADGRHSVLPPHVVAQAFAAPVAHVERRIGDDEVGLQVFVQIAMKAVGVFPGRRAVELVAIDEPKITSPDQVKIKAGRRQYDSFPPVDLTPRGVQHDTGAPK